MSPATPDSTAEMAIDDLNLDLGNLDNLPDIDDATAIATGGHDDLTQIAPHHESTEVLPRDAMDEDDGTALMPRDPGATAVLDRVDFGEIDLDIGAPADAPDNSPTTRDTMKTAQMPELANLEPVTMSEVGTKLDLARAYMDMGDPDGARNILQEVLAEGSASQKQEARRLIDYPAGGVSSTGPTPSSGRRHRVRRLALRGLAAPARPPDDPGRGPASAVRSRGPSRFRPAAGRTDAGVHACAQVAHFETTAVRPVRGWVLGANSHLPPDIALNWALEVERSFHARHTALGRSYRYCIAAPGHAPGDPARSRLLDPLAARRGGDARRRAGAPRRA